MSYEAERLAARLSELCHDYAAADRVKSAGSGFARLFRHWISYNEQRIEAEDRRFLDEVARLTDELDGALASLSREDLPAARRIAAGAVEGLLFFGPASPVTDQDWYLTAAGYESEKLFPYLSREELGRVRDEMCRRTPRRLMFPKQLELLKAVETLLEDQ